ncbi:MAG: hypothetical protein GOV02_02285 [Candidatus Aenigmarchaeota archaeon]|nr:hypothetical protein [Candidatus Aenigmarchaeota archaeon]
MNQQDQMAEFEKMKQEILRKVLSREATERLGRVRLGNPVIATQLELYLVQMYQTGNISDKISDEQLKKILEVLSTKKEMKIKRM